MLLKKLKGLFGRKQLKEMHLDENEKLYRILSSNYNQDNTLNLRVHASEKPSEDFIAVAPQLDDVYFIALKQDELATCLKSNQNNFTSVHF